jgi:pyruvate/2-oxoglutarate dehydrogenase complex dihydrolipoamide acyltransferase (E2) component
MRALSSFILTALTSPRIRQLPMRAFSSSHSDNPLPDGCYIVPMPKLSHRMTQGKITRWLKKPGSRVEVYDILFEVETNELVEEVFKVDSFASSVSLLVESQEEGYLARILVESGQEVLPVGAPIALLVESQESLKEVAALPSSWKPPTTNVYDDTQPRVNVLPWQSYLKETSRKVKCMG